MHLLICESLEIEHFKKNKQLCKAVCPLVSWTVLFKHFKVLLVAYDVVLHDLG